jgi:hypothetical protein
MEHSLLLLLTIVSIAINYAEKGENTSGSSCSKQRQRYETLRHHPTSQASSPFPGLEGSENRLAKHVMRIEKNIQD